MIERTVNVGDRVEAGQLTARGANLRWVSTWRPIEIFLYDWLPLERRRKLCLPLANADVTVERTPPSSS
jgi:hypothetical protein